MPTTTNEAKSTNHLYSSIAATTHRYAVMSDLDETTWFGKRFRALLPAAAWQAMADRLWNCAAQVSKVVHPDTHEFIRARAVEATQRITQPGRTR